MGILRAFGRGRNTVRPISAVGRIFRSTGGGLAAEGELGGGLYRSASAI
jgi:hypothetical protein